MKPFALIFSIVALFAASAQTSRAAVLLSSLTNPTMQTLVALGSDGVTVGSDLFYDFTFAGTSAAAPLADNVAVEPITTDGDGLRFVAAWYAAAGDSMATAITYQVSADPSAQITGVTLFSDGAIPSPDAGTFVSTSLSTRSLADTPLAPTLTTYADGVTTPTDSASFAFTAQTDLIITDSITLASTAGAPGGVATASIVENTFDPLPEPGRSAWFFVPAAVVAARLLRRSGSGKSCTQSNIAL